MLLRMDKERHTHTHTLLDRAFGIRYSIDIRFWKKVHYIQSFLRERSQMTSSKIRDFQTPSPSVIFRHLCHTTYPPRWRHLLPTPLFPRRFWVKSFLWYNFKITKSGFSYEYYLKQSQSTCLLLLAECFRHEITHFRHEITHFNIISCFYFSRAVT